MKKSDVYALRKVGWSTWDPIGLRDLIDIDDLQSTTDAPVDEYDTYLVKAFGMLQNGATRLEAERYLASVVEVHMGLGSADDTSVKLTVLALEKLVREKGAQSTDDS